MNYITITKDIDEVLNEVGISELLDEISTEDICSYLTNARENEELIEMLDIRTAGKIDVDTLDDDEKQVLLWDLIKGMK